jgi:hypothetical protein
LMVLRWIKSIKRPGVATTMCVGNASLSICGFMGIPPQVAAMEIFGMYVANCSKFLKNLMP